MMMANRCVSLLPQMHHVYPTWKLGLIHLPQTLTNKECKNRAIIKRHKKWLAAIM